MIQKTNAFFKSHRHAMNLFMGWTSVVGLNVLLLMSDERITLESLQDHSWALELQIRIAMLVSAVAFLMISATPLQKKIPNEVLSLYLLLFIAFNSVYLWLQYAGNASLLFANTIGFLLLGFFYQGSRKDWWQIYFPTTFLFYVAPAVYRLGLIQKQFGVDFVLLETQKNPVLTIAALTALSAFILGIFRSREWVLPASSVPQRPIPDVVRQHPSSLFLSRPILQTPTELSELRKFELETVGSPQALNILKDICNEKIDLYRNQKYALISLHVPKTVNEQTAFRCESPDLKNIIGQLIDEGVENLGRSRGSVRVSLDLSARQIFIIVEDNGRGLSPEMIDKLKVKSANSQTRIPTQEMTSLLKFWGGDFEVATRLGVGRRVCLRFPLIITQAPEVRPGVVRTLQREIDFS